MTIVRSILYGYLGAILGGLVVAAVALPLNTSTETAAEAATITGMIFGLLGLMRPWRQAAAQPNRRERGATR